MSAAKAEAGLTHVPLESGSDPTVMGKKSPIYKSRTEQKEHFISCSVY